MRALTTLAEAEAALQPFWPTNLNRKHRQTLEFMTRLMEYLGNPQDKLRVIHVAGTSGKTSTAYYAAALLQASGKRVGLTVSPHVDRVTERVQITMQPLSEKEFCAELTIFLDTLKHGGFEPTYFELLNAFAFWEFARQRVEYAVIEVGVGGLLDSTNVMTRADKICVLTDIGLDHTKILGNTLPEIAEQKAGIIHHQNTVFCYQQGSDVMEVFRTAAQRNHADLHILQRVEPHAEATHLPLFQQRNYGLALVATEFLLERDGQDPLSASARKTAAKTYIPARMEIIHIKDRTLILDAAHNAQKLHSLLESVQHQFPDKPIAALVGFITGRTNRVETATKEITDAAAHVIITSFSGAIDDPVSSVDPDAIAAACRVQHFTDFQMIPEPEVAYHALLQRPEPILLVTGSFYLLNHIRPLVAKSNAHTVRERSL